MRQILYVWLTLLQPLSPNHRPHFIGTLHRFLISLLFGSIVLALLLFGFTNQGLLQAMSLLPIDSFETNQAPVALTVGQDVGSAGASTASGSGILGSERDLWLALADGKIDGTRLEARISGGVLSIASGLGVEGAVHLEWDGADADSQTLDPTGLGGVDLTNAGQQDAFRLSLSFADKPVDFTLDVFSDEQNASHLTATSPGKIHATTVDLVLPYTDFVPASGTGATFTNAGAVALVIAISGAPDMIIDSIDTTSLLTASKTALLVEDADGDGQAGPGDTLQYTITISNPDDGYNADATGVVFSDTLDPNTTLVANTVTINQGTVTTGNDAGDSGVEVAVRTLADGVSVTIMFQATINTGLPAAVTEISNQGFVTSDTLIDLPTDDPATDAVADATIIPLVGSPVITATKADDWLDNGDGQLGAGDTLTYTVVIANNGDTAATGVVFDDPLDLNTTLVVSSATTTQGTVTGADAAGVQVDIGSLAGAGGVVTITFAATITDSLPADVTEITNQGLVSGDNIAAGSTDDPDTAATGDPTTTTLDVP